MEAMLELRARIRRECDQAIELLREFRLIGPCGTPQFNHPVTDQE